MKLHSAITINGREYAAGSEVSGWKIYPFFLFHMAMFGFSGFLMAYGSDDVPVGFLYLHGGFAILIYSVFYVALFGVDEVKWMFLNAGLGLLGIRVEIGWLLARFGKAVGDFPWYVHVIPFLYYVLYTFLLRHALLDLLDAREDAPRRKFVEQAYVVVSVAVYVAILLL